MSKAIYKTVDLFGNETLNFADVPTREKTLFDDYEGFTEKFEPKKTTDDCYTPPAVYAAILEYVGQHIDLTAMNIVRPFFPGGDYESVPYTDNCVVIDNPPFSIIAKITRFYIKNNIKFFLFAPHLTLFNSTKCTYIVAGCDIVYENGASVKTSFVSNLMGDVAITSAPDLYEKVKIANKTEKPQLPKYEYPPEICTVSMIQKLTENGIDFRVSRADCHHYRQMDAQKAHGKAIFGSGFLLSEKAAAEKAAAEKNTAVIWELSEKEKQIIKSLS